MTDKPTTGDVKIATLLKEAFETDTDLTAVLERVLDVVVNLTGAECGFILLTEEDGSTSAQVVHNMRDAELPEQDAGISRTIVKQVLESNQGVVVQDAQSTPGLISTESVIRLAIRSVVCAPLNAEEDCRGVIYLENRSLTGVFNEESLRATEQLARSVSRRLGSYLAMKDLME